MLTTGDLELPQEHENRDGDRQDDHAGAGFIASGH